MSHTVKVRVALRDKNALGITITKMHGSVLGEGTHQLYQGGEQGWGFTLPGWRYPLVLKENGVLAYDDFHGHWGNVADLDKLRERYALEAARQAAEAQGWITEEVNGALVIYHPDGGTLTVRVDGTVDASGFVGTACTTATEAIEAALGPRQEQQLKDGYFAERAHVAETEF